MAMTNRAFSLTFLRIILGTILFIEGSGKLWGWFGGNGLEQTRVFYDQLRIPFSPYHALIVASIETFGGAMLVLGLLTRWAVLPVAISMLGALWIIAINSGNVHNSHLIGFAISMVIFQLGPGPWALDDLISTKKG